MLFGQTGGTLKGRIADDDNGEGVAFANVQLEQNGSIVAKCVADIEGEYIMKLPVSGKYDLKAASVGYQTLVVKSVVVEDKKITHHNVYLEPSSIMLRDMVITCCYPRFMDLNTSCPAVTRFDDVSLNSKIIEIDSSRIVEKDLIPRQVIGPGFKIYPNPFMDRAVMEITEGVAFNWGAVSLFDLSGKKIREIDFSGNEVVIEREDLSAGTYLYEISSESKPVATGRIVIQ